jgi:hypothetical protein
MMHAAAAAAAQVRQLAEPRPQAQEDLGGEDRGQGEREFPHFVRPFWLGFAYMLRVLVMK